MDANLPREILKWLQSLDLSFAIKNPKRDLTNGFLVAEILSRYYPRDIDMNSFENGQRLAAKTDNWAQLSKVFKRRNLTVPKEDWEAVVHCAPGAAHTLLFQLYNLLTHRSVATVQKASEPLPAFMRDTASKRMKDHEIERIEDGVERTIRAVDALGAFHEERRQQKALEAPLLIKQERKSRSRLARTEEVSMETAPVVEEIKAKPSRRRSKEPSASAQVLLRKAVAVPDCCAAALPTLPAEKGKEVAEVLRPAVLAAVQGAAEAAELARGGDAATFLEQCKERMRGPKEGLAEVEGAAVRLFEGASVLGLAEAVGDAAQFWKLWCALFPALEGFSESSPVFAGAVFFFKELGGVLRATKPAYAQQLLMEVCLPWLSRELARSPEKRECLCEVAYGFAQADSLSHMIFLRALKDRVQGGYAACLACLAPLDAKENLLDENLLDLYLYYGLMAVQAPQPTTRVAGLSIFLTIAEEKPGSVAPLLQHVAVLAEDGWWEVQAQLLLLSVKLLEKEEEVQAALGLLQQLLTASTATNALQAALGALAPLLATYTQLLPAFLALLLQQPPALRERLLAMSEPTQRITYVMGRCSRMYEARSVRGRWPQLLAAQALLPMLETAEAAQLEVLEAVVPDAFPKEEREQWLSTFEGLKQPVFSALTDSELQGKSAAVLRKFWLCGDEAISAKCLEASKVQLLQALKLLCSQEASCDCSALLQLLRELRACGGEVEAEVSGLVESFQESSPEEYERSELSMIFA